jgi:hypothetical protein
LALVDWLFAAASHLARVERFAPDVRQHIELSEMKIDYGTVFGTALFATILLIVPALAGVITEREKRDCPKDYKAYCGEYGLGSEALRACMSRNIKKISHACVAALVDAGEMTQAQAGRLRSAKTGTATVTKKTAVTTKKGKVTAKKTTTAKTSKSKTTVAKTTTAKTKSGKTVKTATTTKTTKKKP